MNTPRKPRKNGPPKRPPEDSAKARALATALRGHVTAHQLLQNIALVALQTPLTGDTEIDWASRLFHFENASHALVTGNIDTLCYSFFRLGNLDSRFTSEHLQELLERERKINAPLNRKLIINGVLKLLAQGSAQQLWTNDSDHELRIGEVCELVKQDLREGLNKVFEDGDETGDLLKRSIPKPNAIANWLKEAGVVPEYATKIGRSKKDK